jgi:hypothetical protein
MQRTAGLFLLLLGFALLYAYDTGVLPRAIAAFKQGNQVPTASTQPLQVTPAPKSTPHVGNTPYTGPLPPALPPVP